MLQNQLKATTQLIQGHHWDTGMKPHDYIAVQSQVSIYHLLVSKIFTKCIHIHTHFYSWA
jgi:hypothetical protein